jgi:hypothetical protein
MRVALAVVLAGCAAFNACTYAVGRRAGADVRPGRVWAAACITQVVVMTAAAGLLLTGVPDGH